MPLTNAKSVLIFCPHCEQGQTLIADTQNEQLDFSCGACQKNITLTRLDQDFVDSCCICRCKDLHQHKDFNKKLGLGLFLIGAVLAPWTYYASLIATLAIDAALYPFFPWMAVCYKCGAEHRGWPKNSRLDRFNHDVAAHYEYGQ